MRNNVKYNIDDIRKIAESKNGKCLSVNYENNHTLMKWECCNNHIWFDTLKYVLRGKWCKSCVIKNCIICSSVFNPYNKFQTCCSEKCSRVNELNHYIDYGKSENGLLRDKKYRSSDKFKIRNSIYQSHYGKTLIGKMIRQRLKAKRRANKNNIIETFTIAEWNTMKEATKGICPCCRKYVGLDKIHRDHIYSINIANKDYLKTGIKRIYILLKIFNHYVKVAIQENET
jgi:hypothetical protein